ncbi:ferredoxin [Candidatus Roizmanbacteria bacterium]|nr:ferredoxin [Candidatus Roizmanbacteria bacterium]
MSDAKTVSTNDGKKIKVQVDRNLCIGAATCVAVAPKMFALDNEAKAIVLDSSGEESFQSVLDAAKSCPVAAIIIEDEQGNKIYPA